MKIGYNYINDTDTLFKLSNFNTYGVIYINNWEERLRQMIKLYVYMLDEGLDVK